MSSTTQAQQRIHIGVLGIALAALLSGCGGGSDGGAVDVGADGAKKALAVEADTTVQAAPRRQARVYKRQGITAIVMSSDGNTIGVANTDGRVLVLDSAARETKVLRARGGAASTGLVFSADGQYLVAVGRDSIAQGWNIDTGARRFTLRAHEHGVRTIAASANGSVVVTGGEETRVLVWDGSSGQLRQTLGGHTDFVNTVSVSPDGRYAASGDAAARIRVSDLTTGKLLHTLLGHADELNAVTFSPDGRLLASAGEDGKVLLWDVAAGRQVQALTGQASPIRSLVFSPNGRVLAGGAQDGTVVLWDTVTRSVVQTLTGSTSAVNAVVFDRSGRNRLFAGNETSQVLSWNLTANLLGP